MSGVLLGVSRSAERETRNVLSSGRVLLLCYCILLGTALLCLSYPVFCVVSLCCSGLVLASD